MLSTCKTTGWFQLAGRPLFQVSHMSQGFCWLCTPTFPSQEGIDLGRESDEEMLEKTRKLISIDDLGSHSDSNTGFKLSCIMFDGIHCVTHWKLERRRGSVADMIT